VTNFRFEPRVLRRSPAAATLAVLLLLAWGEGLAAVEAEVKPPEAPRRAEAAIGNARSLAEEVRDLREEVSALRQRPQPATAADLERVREELARLAAAERDLARRLDDRVVPAGPVDPSPDGMGTLAPALLVVGGIIGFAASRLLQRRGERRQRNRLRL
jgi:hypothetical protein